jgi:hypothetical protein
MVERVEPTMEEIVVALRETRRGVGRLPPLTVVGGQRAGNWMPHLANGNRGPARGLDLAADTQYAAASTDAADLRDAEIERLLAENARLNERIVFLLKVIEREQACNVAAATETDRGELLRDVKAALDAELRPVLLVLQRLLEKRQPAPPAKDRAAHAAPKASRPSMPAEPSDWIADIGRKLDGGADLPASKKLPTAPGILPLTNLRQRMGRAFDALRG